MIASDGRQAHSPGANRMKITEVETIFVDRYLLVRVHTDAGITGIGEAGILLTAGQFVFIT